MPLLLLGLNDTHGGESASNESRTRQVNDATESLTGDGNQAIVPELSVNPPDRSPGRHSSVLPPSVEELRKKLTREGQAMATVSVDRVPTFGTFKFGYLPGRGLLWSAIGHEVVILALFFLFHYGMTALRSEKLIVRAGAQDHLIYLPELGGGSEGEKSPGGGESAPQEPSASPARSSRGFAYPGRQAILSDPPNPTNAFQTVQRPLLVHPEPIRKLVPLPNIVEMAETRLPSDLIAPRPAMPQPREVPKPIRVRQDLTTHREAKWKIPVSDIPKLQAHAEMPKLPAAEQPMPQVAKVEPKVENEQREVEKPSAAPIKVTAERRAEKAEKQAAPPSPAQVARMEMHGKAREPLLSLSPMPVLAADAKVPAGEARGRFAIAPGGTLNPNSMTPGKPTGTPSIAPGTGQDNSRSPNATNEAAADGNGAGHNTSAGGGSGNGREASGAGSAGTGSGSGNSSGTGVGGTGNGRGRGAAGKGAGTSSGRGAGTGSGAGSGSGSGSFPGITIQGGEEADANANGNHSAITLEPQSTYGITVVSTASSGGGLEDFGVFENERIFTVYIPMSRAPGEADPTWILQYAVLKDDLVGMADPQIVPPAAVMREWPQIPPDLEKKYAERQVVIYAIVNKDGKVGHITVKQTPDTRVSDAIAQALAKWVFRPAKANNRPVSVKILIGIPL